MLSKAKHIFTFGFISILFFSCKNEIKQDVTSSETIVKSDTLATQQNSPKYPIWILEFQRLRQALYQNDIFTITTFFDFPLTTEQVNGLSSAILFNTNKEIKHFSINDSIEYKKYNHQIFPTDFVKSMLPIKSDSLLVNNYATSIEWKRPKDEITYNTTITYESAEQSLSIILNAAYGKGDEKTESAVVYFFKLNKNNQLKFDKVVMAG
jgi:hypothetical protein